MQQHRKLASVARVAAIEPIPGADAIELARIAGWQCVVKKGEFKPGDLGVYLEIDSIPPDDARFSWLWTKESPSRPPKFRIRTLRLRGALSQGLLVSLAAAGVGGGGVADGGVVEGADLTAALGVVKYEPPIPSGSGDVAGPFPGIVPKTDEMRVQSFPGLLEELRGKPFVATVKIDGTSATFVVDGDAFTACSRNYAIKDGDNMYWSVAKRLGLPDVLTRHPHLAIQGEIAGPGIQKNPLGISEKSLFVFSIWDKSGARFLDDADLRTFCAAEKLTPVPLAFSGDSFDETVESLLAKADGFYDGTKNPREGIVIRPRSSFPSTILGGPLSFKAISNKYLLAERD